MNTYQYSNITWDTASKAVFAAILFSTILVAGGYLIDTFTINHNTSFEMPLHVNVGLEDRVMHLNPYSDMFT